jgi:hypothetical protein
MKRLLLLTIFSLSFTFLRAQNVSQVPTPAEHPRLVVNKDIRASVQDFLKSNEEARNAFEQSRQSVELYVNRHQNDPKWMVSRLQMYWKTKSTDVFIKGGVYSHAEGEAPVPTVKFPGTRDNVTIYAAPTLDSILPYMDDPRGVFLINKTKPGKPMEWAEISKTGRILEGINTQIMQLANTAAILYWITKEEKYARFAFDLFDTYMTGMYYRSLPVDLTNGHHQTIVGLSTFEVIQEVAMISNLVGIYDYLFDYLQQKAAGKFEVYTDTFKKWAEVQIQNGVAFNNWNLLQARNILNIGLILDSNSAYKDGKGQQYYTDLVLNKNFERQWSITKIVNEGYDQQAGIWNECPGYSSNVLSDFTGFVTFFDKYFDQDILPQMPVLSKAVVAVSQYLFPNGYVTSFGDSHYRSLSVKGAEELVAHARKNNKPGLEDSLTSFIKTISDFNQKVIPNNNHPDSPGGVKGLSGVLSGKPIVKLKEMGPGKLEDYVTPVFYSPKVSYLALRNGLDPLDGLMVAMSGSKGNHMHAGGISMEIYGKGVVLGPESGIGTSYFQQDYAEYYSQFPAHNTVAVDGISAYPVMKSNHGFDLISSYPASGVNKGYFRKISYADMFFVEPETMADQNRLTSIIRTSDSTGYYVDIFRSRRRDGKDKMHDYFYHNLGQEVLIADNEGKAFELKPTDRLSFSGGHLFAYDYFWDKKTISTSADINTTFTLKVPGKESVSMNMWMKGASDREIFSVKAPPSKAFGHNAMIPDSIASLPMPTVVVRQSGEAWQKPFVAVYEPSSESQPKSVSSISSFTPSKPVAEFEGLVIESITGNKDFVFSSVDKEADVSYNDKIFEGSFGVISEMNGNLNYLFIGNGSKISKGGYSISAIDKNAAAALHKENGSWYFMATKPVTLTLPLDELKDKTTISLDVNEKSVTLKGKKRKLNGVTIISFTIPAIESTKLQ